ncbi:Serine/threonine protein kinase [Syntrophus gentianae]|uniref:non-specific serine/threonine protein kinase n=1 Tax=Syntrophus gentianae TaxID=43775 RepID=A0A1H7Y6Q4_9BACT|nr:HDOD domain-containing protein [Syntrophus gentianae]SEM41564.1 Serine/threonine protein kinase [Syntrophus gentianae]
MSISVIFITVLVLLSVVFFLLKGKEKKKACLAVIKSPTKPLQQMDRTVISSPAMPPLQPDGEETVFPGEGFSTLNWMIKNNIQTGLEDLYADRYINPYPFIPPLEYRNVSPETLHVIRDRLSQLKNFRSVHEQLQRILNDPDIQISDISKMVTSDPVLTAKILKVANSPYFGMPKKLDSINHALLILGIVNVKNILYREGMLRLFLTSDPEKDRAMEKIWKHATLVSICAAHLHSLFSGLNQGSLLTMGLLHDIGKMILLTMPTSEGANGSQWYTGSLKLEEEDRLFGINHAVIAGIALSEWGFSDLMVNVVVNHHVLSYRDRSSLTLDQDQFPYLFVLSMADQLAKGIAGDKDLTVDVLHPSYRHIVEQSRLQGLLQESAFLTQVRESDALSLRAPSGMTLVQSGNSGKTVSNLEVNGAFARNAEGLQRSGDATVVLDSAKTKLTIGRYEILSVIGQGAMGTVYLGRDPLIQRTVAIKTLRYGEGVAIDQTRLRFFREAEAAGGLSHPNIVTVYDVGEDLGTAYIAMEYLDGSDLSKYCAKEALLPSPEVVRIVRDVALALDYAHERGVVHRDIKPANIQISSTGHVTVTDFGIARVVDLSGTQVGTIVGTPNYMSPEQVNGETTDGRTDLFSLGVVLYELLTGIKPFQGEVLTAVMNNIVKNAPIPVLERNPSLPEELAAVVAKAMSKKREERYQSGREMAGRLESLLNS